MPSCCEKIYPELPLIWIKENFITVFGRKEKIDIRKKLEKKRREKISQSISVKREKAPKGEKSNLNAQKKKRK